MSVLKAPNDWNQLSEEAQHKRSAAHQRFALVVSESVVEHTLFPLAHELQLWNEGAGSN